MYEDSLLCGMLYADYCDKLYDLLQFDMNTDGYDWCIIIIVMCDGDLWPLGFMFNLMVFKSNHACL